MYGIICLVVEKSTTVPGTGGKKPVSRKRALVDTQDAQVSDKQLKVLTPKVKSKPKKSVPSKSAELVETLKANNAEHRSPNKSVVNDGDTGVQILVCVLIVYRVVRACRCVDALRECHSLSDCLKPVLLNGSLACSCFALLTIGMEDFMQHHIFWTILIHYRHGVLCCYLFCPRFVHAYKTSIIYSVTVVYASPR